MDGAQHLVGVPCVHDDDVDGVQHLVDVPCVHDDDVDGAQHLGRSVRSTWHVHVISMMHVCVCDVSVFVCMYVS